MYFRGQVIKSAAGRDKDYLMTVVGFDDKFVYVCDGKERRIGNPKRKNPKHIEMTDFSVTEADMNSDRSLRKALARIESHNE